MVARAREHAHTQRRLCERFAAPMIGDVACQDLMTWHMQQVVNAAPTATEGARVHGMISALVGAGVEGGYQANPRLAKVHWQAGDRPLPPPRVSVAGESGLWVDPAEIPSADDVERLGKALAAGRHGERDQLMANTAAQHWFEPNTCHHLRKRPVVCGNAVRRDVFQITAPRSALAAFKIVRAQPRREVAGGALGGRASSSALPVARWRSRRSRRRRSASRLSRHR